MGFWKWLKKQCDKVPSSPGLLRSGPWYVRYTDGNRTHGMTYDTAKDYAKRFGGKVWHNFDGEDTK